MILATLSALSVWMTSAPFAADEVHLEEYGLSLTLPQLEELQEERTPTEQRKIRWSGELNGTQLEIGFYVIEGASFVEPGDVTEEIVDFFRRRGAFDVVDSRFYEGPYGYAELASLVKAQTEVDGEVVQIQYILGGLLQQAGYALDVTCHGQLDSDGLGALEEFFEKGIAYEGEVRDREWTDEEAQERWLREAPEETHEDFVFALSKPRTKDDAIIRTKNYIILTSSSGGPKFAEQMEKNYKEIKKIFPFEDVEGRRLMPVFLFRTPDEYYDFMVKVTGTSRDAAARSKGHAWRDYYATWYEAPKDPVHIHEAVHQIFSNRLRLNGGGSWFQEGVAEYVETSDNDRNNAARIVKKGRHKPLNEFVQMRSLLWSSDAENIKGGNEAGDLYKQAALLIEFLRESKFGKKGFANFVQLMGKVPRGDLEKIEAVFQEVYGVDLEELNEQWMAYCKKR